jgi:predicted GNAT family acetyltransferase
MTVNSRVERVVVDAPELNRFEIRVTGTLAGFAEYRLRPGRIVFTHTEVDSAFEGQGIGSALVRGALDQARERGLQVTPLCPFVKAYIDRHAEYGDLVAAP